MICVACNSSVSNVDARKALGKNWHRQCFRCHECDKPINVIYYAWNNVIYCQKDYRSRFQGSCHGCRHKITGPVMVMGDVKFHTECFCCSSCNKVLSEDDTYTLVERHKLFCGELGISGCLKHVKEMQLGTDSTRVHTVQHFHLPPEETKKRKFNIQVTVSPSVLRKKSRNGPIDGYSTILIKDVKQDGKSRGTSTKRYPLEVGDKVLDVNGILVTNESVEMVSAVMSKPSIPLHITVERDPEVKSNTPKMWYDKVTQLQRQENIIDDEPDDELEKREETDSFFAKNTFKRCATNPSSMAKKPSKEEKTFSGFVQSSPNFSSVDMSNGTKNSSLRGRAQSFPRSHSLNDMPKKAFALHRAQSFKQEPAKRVFRPSDLVEGEVIGKGFFGQVIKVTDKKTNDVMVLKELLNYDEEAKTNFLKEVALLKSLDHTNVLQFIGVVYKGQTLNLIAEYISGGTLRQVLKDKTKELSWSQRVKFATDIASGMAYLHAMGVMHRDLTSKNCLVRKDKGMTVVVADFGLARVVRDSPMSPCVSPKAFSSYSIHSPPSSPSSRPPAPKKRYTVVGSPYWMAPEMLKGMDYNEQVDVFSYGIIMCEIIGRVKADPDFLPRTANFGLDEEQFRRKFCHDCPEHFYRIAFLCCCLDPDKRPEFQAVEKWLEALLLHLEMGIPLSKEVDFSLMPSGLMRRISESTSEEN